MSPYEFPEIVLSLIRKIGIEPDPWQEEVITGNHQRLLLNCARQSGKTTIVALLGLMVAYAHSMRRVVLVSRSLRQAREMFRVMTFYYELMKSPSLKRRTAEELEFENHSRIVCVPCSPETIRGYAHVDLLIIDEAAQVPDDLYRTVRPMLAASGGRLIALSTPFGKRGWFHDAWARGGDDWARIEVSADKCPRISPAFLEQERRALGESWFRQEYFCSFESVSGVVYPDFARCVVPRSDPQWAALSARWEKILKQPRDDSSALGGIDFGFRNPFAALWGILDNDDVLWLTGEHYAKQRPLSYHAERLPKQCMWYADPSGASEISELQLAGFLLRRGNNDIRTGIAAVSARLEDGRLKVLEGRCPNLLTEAGIYRWGESEDRRAEVPVDSDNHALAALRYLVARLDKNTLARRTGKAEKPTAPSKTPEQLMEEDYQRRYQEWLDSDEPSYHIPMRRWRIQ